MKKISLYCALFSLIFILVTSCAVVTKVPKFTSIENILELEPGMYYSEIVTKLGSKPYDVLFCQQEGYTMYLYKYKLIQREIDPKNVDLKGYESIGYEKYSGELKDIWLIVDKNKALESYVTITGKGDGATTLLINNTIYTISMDKGKYTLLPNSVDSMDNPATVEKGKKKRK